MPEGHDTTIEVSNIMSFVLYTQILKQSVLKPASPGITLNPLVTWHLRFMSKTYPYTAHITTNGSLVTGGVREKTPKIWGSFAQNLVYEHFQQPQWDAQSVFLNLICTVLKDWNFTYGVMASYELNSAILLFCQCPADGSRVLNNFKELDKVLFSIVCDETAGRIFSAPEPKAHPSSVVVNFSHFRLLPWNR